MRRADRRRARAALAAVLALPALMAAAPRPVFGDWLTESGEGVIRVAPCGRAVCGTIAGMSDFDAGGRGERDWRGQPECGLTIIRVTARGDAVRLHGTVLNPRDGRVYDAELWVGADGDLRLRGFLGLELLGSTRRWAPFHGRIGDGCHFQADRR